MIRPALVALAVLLAACGSDDTNDQAATPAEQEETTTTSSSGNPVTPAADDHPSWIDEKTLPGATIEPGETFDGHDLWIDTTNHVVYADDCDVARRATNEGGPYAPAPDESGTVIAWGHTCPEGA